MSFAEINLFGVYVAPISLMMIGAWFVTIALRLRPWRRRPQPASGCASLAAEAAALRKFRRARSSSVNFTISGAGVKAHTRFAPKQHAQMPTQPRL
jgi:hypothetical protein